MTMTVDERLIQYCSASLKQLMQAAHAPNRLDSIPSLANAKQLSVADVLSDDNQVREVSLLFFCYQIQRRNATRYAELQFTQKQIRESTELLREPTSDAESLRSFTRSIDRVVQFVKQMATLLTSCASISVHFRAVNSSNLILTPVCSFSNDKFTIQSNDRFALVEKSDEFYWTVRSIFTSEVKKVPWLFFLADWQSGELDKFRSAYDNYHKTLRELIEQSAAAIETISNADLKAARGEMMQAYKSFAECDPKDALNKASAQKSPRELRPNSSAKTVKVSWSCKMQVNRCITMTEKTSILPPLVDMDTLKEAEQTIERKMQIRAVVHPVTGERITLDVAIQEGIIDYEHGSYRNPQSGEQLLSIDQAISERKILVEFVKVSASLEKRHNCGVVTVKVDEKQNLTQTYLVNSVLDRKNNTQLSFDEAVERGILQLDMASYVDTLKQETLSIPVALERGFLIGRGVENAAAAFHDHHHH